MCITYNTIFMWTVIVFTNSWHSVWPVSGWMSLPKAPRWLFGAPTSDDPSSAQVSIDLSVTYTRASTHCTECGECTVNYNVSKQAQLDRTTGREIKTEISRKWNMPVICNTIKSLSQQWWFSLVINFNSLVFTMRLGFLIWR